MTAAADGQAEPRRTRRAVGLMTGVLLTLVAVVTLWLLHSLREEALREARDAVERQVAGAEAALNRSLLGLDLLLAGQDSTLQPAWSARGLDEAQARQLLHATMRQNLALRDLALVDEMAERGTVLEVCPGSNVTLGIYPDFRRHPIAELDRRGVKVTISTDDPPFFHTTMAREYEELNRAFDWDEGQFLRLARQALDAAFCDADTKAKIAKKLEA
ncbi:MAG: hypothetical protein J0M20_17505 [Burkholderiales bacterium]|nr:hypothetical protein [Burkholderiales bacterium]